MKDSEERDGHRYVLVGEDGKVVFLAPVVVEADLRATAAAVAPTLADGHPWHYGGTAPAAWAGTAGWARCLTECAGCVDGECSWCLWSEGGTWVLDWSGDGNAGKPGYFPVVVFDPEDADFDEEAA